MKSTQNQTCLSGNVIENVYPYVELFAQEHNLEVGEVEAFLSEEQLEPYHLKNLEIEFIQQEKPFLTDQDKAFFLAENVLNQSGSILHYLTGEAFESIRRDLCASSEFYISVPTIELMIVYVDRNISHDKESTPYENIFTSIKNNDYWKANELIEEYKEEITEAFSFWDVSWMEYENDSSNFSFDLYEEFVGLYDGEYDHYIDWLDNPDFDVMDFEQITLDLMSIIINSLKK